MKLTVTTFVDQMFTLDISEEIELENFKVLCELECGVLSKEIAIVHDGRSLTENKTSLKALGLRDGDVVSVQKRQGQGQNPDEIRVTNPYGESHGFEPSQTRSLQSSVPSPNLGSPLLPQIDFRAIQIPLNPFSNSPLVQSSPVPRSGTQTIQLKRPRQEDVDLEEQRRIEEEIRKENIKANMNAAMEYSPESFGSVVMLYINCKVNGHPLKAFVDSGAQMTIMSSKCAERCNILRLVDSRFGGIARGVGEQKILGRVHVAQIQIENDFLTSSFSVLEDQPMDIILGLDMLKRHQCLVDLNKGVLKIGTTGTETPFLSEAQLSAAELDA